MDDFYCKELITTLKRIADSLEKLEDCIYVDENEDEYLRTGDVDG